MKRPGVISLLGERHSKLCSQCSLATSLPGDAAGWPYASLVLVAVDHDLTPILLLSDLAEHTRAIQADGRVSLLFDGTAGLDQPLTGPRVTVVGRVRVTVGRGVLRVVGSAEPVQSPAAAQRRGIRMLPANRASQGAFSFQSIAFNISIGSLGLLGKVRGWVSPPRTAVNWMMWKPNSLSTTPLSWPGLRA